ncbi:MAG: mechanosensitive ion channel family protein [Halioglobus sp.]
MALPTTDINLRMLIAPVRDIKLKPVNYFIIFFQTMVLQLCCAVSYADSSGHPLKPADTSSPRATLLSFIDIVNSSHAQLEAVLASYRSSSRLYFSADELTEMERVYERIELARRTLDFSELPTALASTEPLFRYRIFQLKEVLDRLELPAPNSIPDANAMVSKEFKRWTVPGTEITITRVDHGLRAGEYLFSPDTVERLPEFYNRIRHLPYNSSTTAGWYERYRYGGAGLRAIIPLRWMLSLPTWAKAPIVGQPVWRWIAVLLVLLVALGALQLVRQVGLYWEGRGQNQNLRKLWSRFFQMGFLLLLIPLVIHILTVNLRLSGLFLEVATLSLWALFTLTLTWAVWLFCSVSAESIVTSQQLLTGSIDSQLIRLALRLIATTLSVTILVVGAQLLGLPAYSVIAGLGVGGIAFALAARDSLANLLGSLLIMFEKPFRIGHWIKVGDTEGLVESIGFRSTRIRTFTDSLVSIPSDQLVNTAVDNMSMRNNQLLDFVLAVAYSTPTIKIECLISDVETIIEGIPHACRDRSWIRLQDYGESGLLLRTHVYLTSLDHHIESKVRHDLLLEVLKLAEAEGIQLERSATKGFSDRHPE